MIKELFRFVLFKSFNLFQFLKGYKIYFKNVVQLADPVNYLPQLESPPQHLQDEPQRYCVQELFLPDHSLILGRLMLTSWEMGMEGAEDSAAEILVHAVQVYIFLIISHTSYQMYFFLFFHMAIYINYACLLIFQYFLKNLLTVVLAQRNGYKLRDKKMIYSLGCPVPNPWLRSYHGLVDNSLHR